MAGAFFPLKAVQKKSMKKKGYLAKRLGHSALTLWLILTLNFFLFRMLPGDPLRLLFADPGSLWKRLKNCGSSTDLTAPCCTSTGNTC